MFRGQEELLEAGGEPIRKSRLGRRKVDKDKLKNLGA